MLRSDLNVVTDFPVQIRCYLSHERVFLYSFRFFLCLCFLPFFILCFACSSFCGLFHQKPCWWACTLHRSLNWRLRGFRDMTSSPSPVCFKDYQSRPFISKWVHMAVFVLTRFSSFSHLCSCMRCGSSDDKNHRLDGDCGLGRRKGCIFAGCFGVMVLCIMTVLKCVSIIARNRLLTSVVCMSGYLV